MPGDQIVHQIDLEQVRKTAAPYTEDPPQFGSKSGIPTLSTLHREKLDRSNLGART